MAAGWRDIYSYLVSGTPQNIGDVTNSGGGDDPRGTSGPSQFGTGKWVGNEYQVPDKYKGIIDVQHTMGGGEDPKASSSINIDWTKLPNGGMTPYGRVDRTIQAEDPTTPVGKGQQNILKDPKLVYNDPNFGWITPATNRKQSLVDKLSAIEPYAVFAAASAGMGALASVPFAAQAAMAAGKYAGGRTGPGVTGGNPLQNPFAGQQAPVANVTPSSLNRGGISLMLTPQSIQLLRMARGG